MIAAVLIVIAAISVLVTIRAITRHEVGRIKALAEIGFLVLMLAYARAFADTTLAQGVWLAGLLVLAAACALLVLHWPDLGGSTEPSPTEPELT